MRVLSTYFFALLFVCFANAQEVPAEDLNRSTTAGNDVSKLVTYITQGKSKEFEKFEAIFNWVSQNIRYDYNVYFSSQGTSYTNIKKVLRSRRAICADYATLMDTLCHLAHINNVQIYGYAKDEIFDVNDSLYLDNHAWNAVRLDGLWYLYDVTWASGSKSYEYRPFSRFLLKVFEKIKPKYNKKKIKQKTFFPGSMCKTEPAYEYKQRFFNRLLIRPLSLFNLRIREIYTRETNKNFYLSDPKLFSVTHYPDDPVWTLLENKTFRNFECDSAFYHLTDSSYKNQQAQGVVCEACDSALFRNKEESLTRLKEKSLMNNRRNRFITSYCEFSLGTYYREQVQKTPDSLLQTGFLNSALTRFEECGESLKQCKKNVETDFLLQKKKNRHKQDLLLEDNERHSAFLKKQAELILTESKQNKRLASRIKVVSSKEGRTDFYLPTDNSNNRPVQLKKKMQEKLDKLNSDYRLVLAQIDSINNEIHSKEANFDMFLSNLVLRVWQKGIHIDSLMEPFKISSYYRRLLRDNYKKEVVEIRKLIPVYEKSYEYDLANNLFAPSGMTRLSGDEIITALNRKIYLQKNSFRMAKELAKYGMISPTSMKEQKSKMERENKEECCWLESRVPELVSTYMGFDFLKTQQRRMEVVINFENSKERARLYKIEAELKRRKRKYKNIIFNNSSALIVKKRQVKVAKKKLSSPQRKRNTE